MGGSEIQSVSDLRAQRACAHLTERNSKRTRAAHSAQLEIDSGSPLLWRCRAPPVALLLSSPPFLSPYHPSLLREIPALLPPTL